MLGNYITNYNFILSRMNSYRNSINSRKSSDINYIKDSKTDEVFWYKDYKHYKDFLEEKKYKERLRREMIEDLIDGFCSPDDTRRIDNMIIRWRISRRNAAELIANFELQQSIIDSTWV